MEGEEKKRKMEELLRGREGYIKEERGRERWRERQIERCIKEVRWRELGERDAEIK